jgi:sensor histidine kinase regulating citrate/malate metabolism
VGSAIDQLNQYLISTLAGLQKQGSYLSRWKYELTLDDVAAKIGTLLDNCLTATNDTEARFGIALLYRVQTNDFMLAARQLTEGR